MNNKEILKDIEENVFDTKEGLMHVEMIYDGDNFFGKRTVKVTKKMLLGLVNKVINNLK